jgi:hypothetical protein
MYLFRRFADLTSVHRRHYHDLLHNDMGGNIAIRRLEQMTATIDLEEQDLLSASLYRKRNSQFTHCTVCTETTTRRHQDMCSYKVPLSTSLEEKR